MSVLSRTALSRGFSQIEGFTVKKDGDDLAECFPGTLSIIVKASNKLRNDVQQSVDRAGLQEIEAQYNPSSHAKISSREFGRVTSESGSQIPTSMPINSKEFAKWFQDIITLESNGPGLVKETPLVLDTNVIMGHYIRNLLYPILGDRINTPIPETIIVGGGAPIVRIRIPRLCLLEIERRFNESKEDSMKRRLALYAAREILFLKSVGAEFLPDLEEHTLEGFSRIAGEKFSDAWIRREVKEYWQTKTREGGVNYHPLVFVTCDLMNALAASAEGLGVLHLSHREERDEW